MNENNSNMESTFIEILKVLSPVLTAVIAVAAGGGGYFWYKATRPKTTAEAQKLNAEVVVTFADGWQKLYQEVLDKMQKMEDRYEARVTGLEAMIREKDEAHSRVVAEKDKRIDELEKRVDDLEAELEKYRGVGKKVDRVKESLHHDVESKLDEIKAPTSTPIS